MPPHIPEVSLDQEPMVYSYDPLTVKLALTLVNKTFWHYEAQRQQNHENRWLAQESLYLGWLPPKVWEGTNIPRANLAMPITFDQIETALPILYAALFEQSDAWFEIVSNGAATTQTVREIQGYLEYVLEHLEDEYGNNARQELLLMIKDILMYGNGGGMLEWDTLKGYPKVKRVDLRDLYVDTATPGPNIDFARSVVFRRLMTVDELNALRSDSRMNIPNTGVLWYMARTRPITTGDTSQRYRDALRNIQYSPGSSDILPNPADNRVEVLVYYSRSRIIWALNRQWIAYIGNNPYNCIPMFFAPCYSVPNRFYGLSMAEVQEGNQRYAEALMNGRLDEITLGLHPPRIQRRGSIMTPAQQRWRPGAVFTAGDAKDILFQNPAGVASNIYPELEYLSLLSEKRTGVNSMIMGSPRGGNVNRSATGVQAQRQGSTSRLQMIAKNIEDYLIVAMIRKIIKMVQVHVPTNQWLPSLQNGQQSAVRGAEFHKKIQVRVLASSRMMAKDELVQVVGPLLQFMMSGPFLQQLQMSGRTVDFNEVFEMIQMATGTKRRFNFIRDLTEQEQQALNQPPPEVQAEQARADQAAQIRLQMGQMKLQGEQYKGQVDLQKEMIKKQPDENAQIQTMIQAEVQRELARIKLQAEREKNQMNLLAKQQELQLKSAEGAQKLQQMSAEGEVKLRAQQQQNEVAESDRFKQDMLKDRSEERSADRKIRTVKETEKAKAKSRPKKKAEK